VLKAFINEVESQSGEHITPEAAAILIADARWVIYTLLSGASGSSVVHPFGIPSWVFSPYPTK